MYIHREFQFSSIVTRASSPVIGFNNMDTSPHVHARVLPEMLTI